MNIVCVPYHDWRKITLEGARTRDSHIMSHLMESKDIDNVIILNRPISFVELYLKRKNQAIKGELLFRHGKARLHRLNSKAYLIDYVSHDLLGPVLKKKQWFFDSFSAEEFRLSYEKCLEFLNINVDVIFSQNIFAAGFVKHYRTSVFDAWDNFILFPENSYIYDDLKNSYLQYAESSTVWITNSRKNSEYYDTHYKPKLCLLIKNGVDVESFARSYDIPDDLKPIKLPIVGFGGKITHLFNFDFFNYAVKMHPDKSFVIVGQVLDKSVFEKIAKAKNVFYLGDKHYNVYKSYVTNFDIGIVPYVTDHLEHGADSIKMYEYIASGLSVVGTPGAGMNDMASFIHIATTKEDFSDKINTALSSKDKVKLADEYTWEFKTAEIVKAFNNLLHETNRN